MRRELIEQAWEHGFIHINLLGNLPVGSGSLPEARVAAGYLSKYVAKTFSDLKPSPVTSRELRA